MAAAVRFILLAELIRDWRERLTHLRRTLTDDERPDRWIREIRARILTFLVARYSEQTHDPKQMVQPPRASSRPFRAVFFVEPEDHPPKAQRHLRPLLSDIREQNWRARPRWRFWP